MIYTYFEGNFQLIFDVFGKTLKPGHRSSFGAPTVLKIFEI